MNKLTSFQVPLINNQCIGRRYGYGEGRSDVAYRRAEMNTPKTDAAEMRYRYHEKRGDWEGQDHFDYVEPEFARQLETQVMELETQVMELVNALEKIASMRVDAATDAQRLAAWYLPFVTSALAKAKGEA